ncbi:MAG: tetratricopeptide repeat protein, partial [Armatimonadetes bacterium]|nr:tetratricopeptide repeat protein [Armatimonadota bacterium]
MTALDQSQASPAPLPSLKTLLVTDLVDSTKLTEKLGDRHAGEIYERHDRLARDLLLRFGGREIAKADGFTLIFERPIDAVCFALVYHDELAALSQELGTDAEKDGFRLAARVGIHLGEVVLRENPPEALKRGARPVEMEGLAVSIVARVMSLAGGAQTLMTRAPFDLARRGAVGAGEVADDIRWLEHGPYLFKGVSETMTVCEVGREGCAPLTPPPNSEKAERDIAPGDEKTLGWRPAPGLAIPEREGWKLERRLGVGGFGEVWLAEQKRTHEQRAFKFCFRADRLRSLKRELTLFRLIKEVLGDRSDIVRLYEVHLDQAPFYLEMGYAAGGDLPGWAEDQGGLGGIDLNTRLEIVAQVAVALSAAHSVGVIHKDVKPSNVLVHEERGGRLQARLSDFGIGQLLDKESLEQAGVTVTGFTETGPLTELASRTGTRLYMAPELMAGKPASIQSDIYALGVLLYQVVVADLNRPLAQGWEGQVKDELLREDIAACVAGDPGHRLSGADLLARSLRSLAERRRQREAERKRVAAEARRRRLLRMAGLSSFVLLIIAGVAAVGLVREAKQRHQAETARDAEAEQRRVAETQAGNAQAINDFLTDDLLAAVAPSAKSGKGKDVLMRDVLDEASKKIDTASAEGGKFANRPLIEASIRATLGSTYRELGEYAAAEPHLERARLLRRREFGEEHPATLHAMNNLAILYLRQGRYGEAVALFVETLESRKRVLGDEHLDTLASMNNLANLYLRQGRYDQAEPLYVTTLEIQKRVMGEEHLAMLYPVNNLAILYYRQGRYDEAEPLYVKTLEIRKRVLGEEHPRTLGSMQNLASLYVDQGRYDEAERLNVKTLEIQKRVLGEEHSDTLSSMSNLASLYMRQGRYGEAEPLSVKTLETEKRVLGEGHPDTLKSMNNLAVLYQDQGRYNEAEPLYVKTLEIEKRVLGEEHPETLRTMNNLATLYGDQGRTDDARPLVRALQEVKRRGADRPGASASDKNELA